MKTEDIAPCGINCSICSAYQREKNKCSVCNGIENKPTHCKTCSIRYCGSKQNENDFCALCEKYPCRRLKTLYKRYSEKYGVDIFHNLEEINSGRIKNLITEEEKKWKCTNCENTLCMHKATCINCDDINPYYIGTRT